MLIFYQILSKCLMAVIYEFVWWLHNIPNKVRWQAASKIYFFKRNFSSSNCDFWMQVFAAIQLHEWISIAVATPSFHKRASIKDNYCEKEWLLQGLDLPKNSYYEFAKCSKKLMWWLKKWRATDYFSYSIIHWQIYKPLGFFLCLLPYIITFPWRMNDEFSQTSGKILPFFLHDVKSAISS